MKLRGAVQSGCPVSLLVQPRLVDDEQPFLKLLLLSPLRSHGGHDTPDHVRKHSAPHGAALLGRGEVRTLRLPHDHEFLLHSGGVAV